MNKIVKHLLGIGLIVAFLVPSVAAMAQAEAAYVTVSGVVKDENTRKEVSFASISIPGTHVGTVANADGEFTLKVLKSLNATDFEVTHIGYHNKKFNIEEALKNGKTYYIAPHSVQLKEVIVRPEDPESILKGALANVRANYSDIPNILVGFYRETIKQKRDYVSISEAVVDVYKGAYQKEFDYDRVRVYRGRKSGDVKKADTLVVKLQGGPHIAMMLDIVKNPDVLLDPDMLQYYSYEVLDLVSIDNEMNYVIGFTPRVELDFPLYIGKVYVTTETLAISMVEFSMDLSDPNKAALQFVRRKPAGLRFTPTTATYLVTYKKQNDRYFLNYVRTEVAFKCKWNRKIFSSSYTIMSEMAITDRQMDGVTRFTAKESLKSTSVLADMVPVYFDEDFWGEYNVIEPEESIQSAIKKLNRKLKKNGN
ncbi:MAG: carboxypeptidase-like regulatory domain-containing protein [Bacteroidales bacterium]|nr:carboxypeptidase-like regulatory domain-containing protein [Bacteroidales bacterium]MBN2748850.1 carboxypeptidase-like regulatory domain-containing protein [Bacteroidales bacterium]